MNGSRSTVRRVLVMLVAILSVIAFVGGQAHAAPDRLIVCNATGTVVIVEGPPGPFSDSWTVTVSGSCTDASGANFAAAVEGSGTSDTLGACDEVGFVQNLHIKTKVTLVSVADPTPTVLEEKWDAPITTFPVAVPFSIQDAGFHSENDVVGSGVIFTRVAGRCPPAGQPAANIYWTRYLA